LLPFFFHLFPSRFWFSLCLFVDFSCKTFWILALTLMWHVLFLIPSKQMLG
jgi:hypothetical protein